MSESLVQLVAGLLSTFPPHDTEHPEACLPMAGAVLDMLITEGHLPPPKGDRLLITVMFPIPVNEFCEYLNVIERYHPGMTVDTSGPGGWKLTVPASE